MPGARVQKNPPRVLQLLRVSALSDLSEAPSKKMRKLSFSGAMLAISGITSVWLVAWLGAADVADVVALRMVAYVCWLIGGLGLWALLSKDALREDSQQLASLRGTRLEVSQFTALAVMRKLGKTMVWASLPALIIACFVSTGPSMLAQKIALIFGVLGYLFSLAVVLSLVALFSIRFFPGRANWAAAALILGPFLLTFTSSLPASIPGLFIWGFEKLIAWGGLVA